MSTRQQIEEQIRELLANETRAIPLTNQLFSPDGLFAQLGPTLEERRAVVNSELFRQAQQRVSELQQQEAEEFSRLVRQAKAAKPDAGLVVKLEQFGVEKAD